MYLIVGLGNPGSQYQLTRHNIGFMFLDHLAGRYAFSFRKSDWQASVEKMILWGEAVLLLKPETYMNRSGGPVARALTFYHDQLSVEKIIVIHDDLDLEVGRIRIAFSRGAGGHKGVTSIMQTLGTKDFIRIKVGIGRPDKAFPVDSYVLSRFSAAEMAAIDECYQTIEKSVEAIIRQGTAEAMTQFNRLG